MISPVEEKNTFSDYARSIVRQGSGGTLSENPDTKEEFDMRKRVSFPAVIIPNSPTVAIFSAVRQLDQSPEFCAKKRAYLHKILNEARFEAFLQKYDVKSVEKTS